MSINFGRETCSNLNTAEDREWLVTNGIGGYASGTVAGLLTRRYHGLLIAALKPPLGRTLLLTKLDETVVYDGHSYPLFSNRWAGDQTDAEGLKQIEQFQLEGTVPTWRFACADALLEKRIWMQQGTNTTYIYYTLRRATQPMTLTVKTLVNYRDYHSSTQAGNWHMAVDAVGQGIRITAFAGATPFYLLTDCGTISPVHTWYYGFDLAVERYRGLGDREDHLHAATLDVTLQPGESFTVVASTDRCANLQGAAALETRCAYEQKLISVWKNSRCSNATAPDLVNQLVLAADQFIVDRSLPDEPNGKTVIAGYHWFGDWGRDTMISLPGLTLSTGRPEIARSILRTFAKYIDQGMLPNYFPDISAAAEYNTVDAVLWYFEAIRQYHELTNDDALVEELFPVLAEIIDWHCQGTRYNIHRDPSDGLLYSGEAGVQLTWMDAKIGDWVVTPRRGKPIEVNALWYNALRTITKFARLIGKPDQDYQTLADKTAAQFGRFWNPSAGYCYDVLDSPTGNDASLRPNQIFAVSLPVSPLTAAQQQQVVEVCGRVLLTSQGLRSLAPNHPQYQGHYGGSPNQRDSAYHQGTTWGWLLGAFVQAHLRVFHDPAQARSFLEPMANHLTIHGVGSLSEIFDGDAPMTPRGCVAQAWTVAEVLRAWLAIEQSTEKKTSPKRDHDTRRSQTPSR
jgi:predicted glycogen debranching enzyme